MKLQLKTYTDSILRIDEDGSIHILRWTGTRDFEDSLQTYKYLLTMIEKLNNPEKDTKTKRNF